MRTLLMILFLCSITAAYSHPKGETLAEEMSGTWRIKNVQKMQGLVIRTEKYTKDGGDSKAYINRFKGCMITMDTSGKVTLVTANGKRTIEGTWEIGSNTKYRVKAGKNLASGDNSSTEDYQVFTLKFPTARSYNIEGDYRPNQFGLVKVKGKFAVVDPKYMFKFEKTDTEEEEDK